jgi:hypothetical protein
MDQSVADKILNGETDTHGWKTTELWLTTITGLVNTILVSAAPNTTTNILIICLTTAAVVYLLCRTVFKIARLRYRPNEIVNFALQSCQDKLDSEI